MEDDRSGRKPQQKTISTADNLDGRQPKGKTSSMKRQPQKEMTSREKTSMGNNLKQTNKNTKTTAIED